MINIIQNTIGALGRTLGIVKKNLQLWLDFNKSEVIGSDVIKLDFNSDWVDSGALVVDDSNSFTTTGDGTIKLNTVTTVGSVYDVVFSGTTTVEGLFRLRSYDGGTTYFTHTTGGAFSGSFQVTANTEGFRIRANAAGVTDITTFSVKEVSQFVKDKSPNTNNAKLFTGKALSFNGNDAVTDFGNPNVNLKSICFWVNLDTTTEQLFNLTATHSIEAVSGVITLNGTWSNSNIYVDGIATTSIGTTPKRVVVTTDTNILVSDLEFTRIGTDYGSLDLADVQIYDAEFTLADALLDYNNPNHLIFDVGGSIALANLKGYWALSEGDGLVAYDSSGEGNNGTINGATYTPAQDTIPQLGMVDWAKSTPVADEVTLIQAPNNKGFDILGSALRLREHAFNLDGSGYGEVADDTTLNISNGTLQFWLKTSDTKFNILSGQSTSEFIGTTNNSVWSFGNAGTITSYIGAATANTQPLYNGNWSFYTFTGVDLSTWTAIEISNLAGFELDGILDEVMIYSSVLTTKEIKNNYNIGINKHKASSSFSNDFSSDYGI